MSKIVSYRKVHVLNKAARDLIDGIQKRLNVPSIPRLTKRRFNFITSQWEGVAA